MVFKDLKIGDNVFILENAGTFRKVNTYNVGTVTMLSQPYDDLTNTNPYMNNTMRKKLIDVTITCEGVQKKLTVGADKATITDPMIGLTVSTNKDELITQVTSQCKEYESKIKAIEYYKVEIQKCQDILSLLKDDIKQDYSETETIKVS